MRKKNTDSITITIDFYPRNVDWSEKDTEDITANIVGWLFRQGYGEIQLGSSYDGLDNINISTVWFNNDEVALADYEKLIDSIS